MTESRKELEARILASLKEWLVHEDETIEMTNKVTAASNNASVKLIMDIIRMDSVKHKRIQQYMIDSMETSAPAISYDEISSISGIINEHIELEQKTVDLSAGLADAIKFPIQARLFEYLQEDEKKHVILLKMLANYKDWATKNT
jgi:hypothetical protein